MGDYQSLGDRDNLIYFCPPLYILTIQTRERGICISFANMNWMQYIDRV